MLKVNTPIYSKPPPPLKTKKKKHLMHFNHLIVPEANGNSSTGTYVRFQFKFKKINFGVHFVVDILKKI